ncbi:non-ribosomal peptide synthetase [Paenibacillus macquariensis]|uniref:Surfactin family lipopeptide synthetase A/iturin family lipopeptide synthetase B/fengycin family lipopeptide synthetase D/gramicidin S synthase 2/tyrocidine synthetase-2 n=1 Tax=Paenibacillus macquariensis TaxID=948756 RepID=A0ABY1K308_9BACL|nr:non-ribosomal peptide synthetase [Paenibacillus macquariensis]MEC0090297.1 non-ribosomal peptide synthetase [Paenibacillus macquariensis]OAB39655.1 hypothetical protein PMSM_00570 [Paenibacillus macquariensis subsp. macquariensis]SIR19032.1 surfactin family lipopeptide synthetase A/iturin family lipopeptide synthetase B/fengycin family lipopeptide synthetase D/gramicidin S synthase 2/tyrocidine synthetase-2 [Paenibacillus macquariensis]
MKGSSYIDLCQVYDKSKEYPRDKTIHELFEEQVKYSPNETAVIFDSQHLTYKELNERANQIAWILREKGVSAQEPVGIMLDRSLEFVVSVLAILKAGGAFVPVDSDYPETRIRYMLQKSGIKCVLTQQPWHPAIPKDIDRLDVYEASLLQRETENLQNWNESTHLMYIIYTSGTTGNPKGVMLEHRNLVNLLYHQYNSSILPFSSNILQYASSSFDVCYQEMFSALLFGGSIILINKEDRKNPSRLFTIIKEKNIEVLYLPVTFLNFIFSESEWFDNFPSNVKHIITAGEQLVVTAQIKSCLHQNQICLHNHYGPSETHVVTTFTMFPDEIKVGLPPIGAPISNTKIYILDDNMDEQGIGNVGELYIAGDSLGRGYYERQDLTEEKFVVNPFVPGERIYKTGDMARFLLDGNVEYLGRIDHQVKIRGFRIELAEVEFLISQHPDVKEQSVFVHEDNMGYKHLVAYVSSHNKQKKFKNKLWYYINEQVAEYMRPSIIIEVDHLPLTLNGKIDRAILKERFQMEEFDHQTYLFPRTEVESQVASIWTRVLGISSIGINDNFFHIGGHSLMAVKLIWLLKNELGIEISMKILFSNPSIATLSKQIMSELGDKHKETIS